MKVPGNIRSWEQNVPVGTFVPRNKSSRELSFLGVKVPTGNFCSEERKYRGAKSPDTVIIATVYRLNGDHMTLH